MFALLQAYSPIVFSKFLLFELLFVSSIHGWSLDYLNLNESRIQVSHLVNHGERTLLCIPRVYDEQPYTLVQVPPRENFIFYPVHRFTKPFPNRIPQTIGDCDLLQSVVTADSDGRGRIYVLDIGYRNLCQPKIVVYDLISNQYIKMELDDVPTTNLHSLVIDVNPYNNVIRAILGDAGQNSLLVYNFMEQVWWRMSLKKDNNDLLQLDDDFSFDQLTIDRMNSVLYASSSQFSQLFSVDLNAFRRLEEPLKIHCNEYGLNQTEIEVQYVGEKFGKSSAIFVDYKGRLYYVYDRDFVLIKWDTKDPFQDEYMEVLVQDYKTLADTVQIYVDSYKRICVLKSNRTTSGTYTVEIKPTY